MMSMDIARNVALVTYGNLFLQGRDSQFDIETLVTHNCYRLDFVEPTIAGVAGSVRTLASDAYKWFKYLKDNGVKVLKLHFETNLESDLPDHISAAFIGGGSNWFIEAQSDHSSALYLCGWIPTESGGYDLRKTHYLHLNSETHHLDNLVSSVNESREELSSILQELSEFAGRFDYSKHWSENFKTSHAILLEFEPKTDDELLPAGIYSKEARQLIEGALSSWVFGGMGSWNDMSFDGDDQDLYSTLSDRLYTAICSSIVSGVNSYP
ncbi:MAG: hypothetical protein JW779_15870 [Candidatus Thorarchaeota archaeon]|nr:hypothetical protein [Candidatus Thorarchaeota archaeon]